MSVDNILSVLMPTVAKFSPDIYNTIKKYISGKKMSETMILAVSLLEMQAKSNSNMESLFTLLTQHEDNAITRCNNCLDIAKETRDKIEDLQSKIPNIKIGRKGA